jgi:hypothetical protein
MISCRVARRVLNIELLPGSLHRGCIYLIAATALAVLTMTPANAAAFQWSPLINVSAAGEFAFSHQVAVDSIGNATIVWEANDNSGPSVKMSRIPLGSLPSAPVRLSQNPILDAPQVAVDAGNSATIVWTESNGVFADVRMARVSPAGVVSSPTSLSTGETVMFPRIGANARGDVWITWAGGVVPGAVVRAVQIPASGAASAAITWRALTSSRAPPRSQSMRQGPLRSSGRNSLRPPPASRQRASHSTASRPLL